LNAVSWNTYQHPQVKPVHKGNLISGSMSGKLYIEPPELEHLNVIKLLSSSQFGSTQPSKHVEVTHAYLAKAYPMPLVTYRYKHQ
jgi:hypothetical protein